MPCAAYVLRLYKWAMAGARVAIPLDASRGRREHLGLNALR